MRLTMVIYELNPRRPTTRNTQQNRPGNSTVPMFPIRALDIRGQQKIIASLFVKVHAAAIGHIAGQ